ncbi:RidA family protein [Kluyvera georgiana]|uniref:RidA family protein n=1 Tax=Kluyvera georgiana TaxID=73098 RepID=UPI002304A672|nr:RidA family protein [Kluyvera georgiana]MDA8492632.1 RidA family protein [Kluyvera georgiana]
MALVRYPTSKPFPFSDAVAANGFLFLSGQVSMSPDGQPLYGTITEQVNRIMRSVSEMLARGDAQLRDVVRAQVWLSDMAHFAEFNQAWRPWFPEGFPSRSVTTSSLAFNLDVEIEFQAVLP